MMMVNMYIEKFSGLMCRVYEGGAVVITDVSGALHCPSHFTPATLGTVFGSREFVKAAVKGCDALSNLTRLNWCEQQEGR